MTYGTIEIQAGQGVAVLWLNRPEVRNAFNETMIAELTAAFDQLEADRAVRAVVLAGRGKVFCAGADLNWMKKMGGLGEMEKVNLLKAGLIYQYLDGSRFFSSPVAKEDRSIMNIPFRLKDDALDEEFLKQARARGLTQLKGHRSVGGMRASIYNAMPVEGVRALVQFMREFEARHG